MGGVFTGCMSITFDRLILCVELEQMWSLNLQHNDFPCRWRLRPRILVDVSKRTTKTTVLGHDIGFPVCVAPTGFHRLAHPDGEVAVARGKLTTKVQTNVTFVMN
jgi:isopentenyl diphosphate isomerase/L-lactate dehydrogenase-like FMN-dependent dehydrogenase